jgi:hypothetical protein
VVIFYEKVDLPPTGSKLRLCTIGMRHSNSLGTGDSPQSMSNGSDDRASQDCNLPSYLNVAGSAITLSNQVRLNDSRTDVDSIDANGRVQTRKELDLLAFFVASSPACWLPWSATSLQV